MKEVAVEYRILGRLEVLRNGEPIELGPYRQRALLAMLLTSPNSVFSTDQLIDGLWGDDGTAERQNSLWVYVSGLRKALEPEREKRSEGTILLTRAPGYTLQCDPSEIDAVRFERMITEGRALSEVDPAVASLLFGEALALWRGRSFEEFVYESFPQMEIRRLEELRLEAVEARIDADLRRGMARELISELETLVRQHPLHEQFTGQLMLALYRSGRQAEALRAYQMLAAGLGEELGIAPSSALSRLEEQIVLGDDALTPVSIVTLPGGGPGPGLSVRGYELREKIGEGKFGVAYRAYQPAVGREVAIKVIRPELANDPDFIRRFEAEAQLVARLEHPHIVPLLDYWREPSAAYLVMRLMRGGSLAEVLETGALTPEHAARMADQIAGALRAAHRAGVVHRDIRPANILIDGEGNAYLSDFGIAVGDDGEPRGRVVDVLLGPPYASPEQLNQQRVTPASDVFSFGVVLAQALSGLTGDVERIRGALPPDVMRVVDRATLGDASARYTDVGEFASELGSALLDGRTSTTADPHVDIENPYKGLRSFDRADADDFHGRERLVERLVAALGDVGAGSRFVALVGPSGSGKSSVVRAGLLPALAADALPASRDWFTIQMTPAPYPFEELEAALLSVAVDPPTSLLEIITRDEHGLLRAARRVLPDDGSQLLVVIDQFEELFTQVDEATADRFLDSLVATVRDTHSKVKIVITLRADFYDRPLRHRGLGELLRDGTEVITPMTPEELERAITEPASRVGVAIESALVVELVSDVIDRQGALPLLQYTLTELFDGRTSARISRAEYHDLGGVSGALVVRADGILSGLGEGAREATRQVFLRLVTLGEGADDTRRRVLLSELEQLPFARADLRAVLDTFGRHRLLEFDRDPVTRGPTVEISHEALLTAWATLRNWIDGARDDVRNQRRLSAAMADWLAEGRTDAYLLRGGSLERIHGWAQSTALPLSAAEQSFLDESVARRRAKESERIEREQRTVEAERRARLRARQLMVVGFAGVVVALVAVFALVQWQRANRLEAEQVAQAQSSAIAVAAVELLSTDPELSLLLGIESVRATVDYGYATEDAVDSIHWALQRLRVPYDVGAGAPVALRLAPDGPVGVFHLPPGELVAFAQGAVDRRLSPSECDLHLGGSCHGAEIPSDLELQFGEEAYGVTAAGEPRALRGTTVTLQAGNSVGLPLELAAFREATGIDVQIVEGGLGLDVESLVRDSGEGAELPDILTVGSLGTVVAAREDLRPVDLLRYVEEGLLRDDFGDYLIDTATVDGSVIGIPAGVGLDGLVFFARQAFEAAGYEVPSTWAELRALTAQMRDDGATPWCLAFEAGGVADGFPGTDLFEAILIGSAGVDIYDAWTDHDIPFTHPEVVAAGRVLDELLKTPGNTQDPSVILETNWLWEGLNPVIDRITQPLGLDQGCWLHPGAHWYLGFPGLDGFGLGRELDFFMLPPVEPGNSVAVTGTHTTVVALDDRPEVRQLMQHIASPQWWERAVEEGRIGEDLPANRRFDLSVYENSLTKSEVHRRLGEIAQNALRADAWRSDASDLMPPEVGGLAGSTPDGERGEFLVGMTDLVAGIRTIEEVLTDVEAEWAALPGQ